MPKVDPGKPLFKFPDHKTQLFDQTIDLSNRGETSAIYKGFLPLYMRTRDLLMGKERDKIDDEFNIFVSHQMKELGGHYIPPSRRGNPLQGSAITQAQSYKDFEHIRRKKPVEIAIETYKLIGLARTRRRDAFDTVPFRMHRGEMLS